MNFPHDWVVLAAEEFETAAPRVNGGVTMEVLAQLRPSGRILDNFRVALVGSKALDFDAVLFSLIPAAIFKGWRVKGQCWARDVAIRANVFSSGWIDLAAAIAMRELDVFDAEGAGIPAGEFLRLINDLDEDGPCAASYRFAVVVGRRQQTSPANPESAGLSCFPLREGSPQRVRRYFLLFTSKYLS
jgi:hypothetical protein